jgi:hypothetical protein
MTATAVLAAERIKLVTTRSPIWSTAAVVVLSLGYAAMQAGIARTTGYVIAPERAALGVAAFGVPVLMILAALTVTGEYRTGLIKTTLLATPNRTLMLSAKAAISAAFASALTAVMVLGAIVVAKLLAKPSVGVRLSLGEAAAWRPVGAIALYGGLCAVLAVGLGALLRHSAGVVAILVIVPFLIEPLAGSLPNVGPRIGPLLPFMNAFTFTEAPWLVPKHMYWGPFGALGYFTGIVAIVFVAGLVAINYRDA